MHSKMVVKIKKLTNIGKLGEMRKYSCFSMYFCFSADGRPMDTILSLIDVDIKNVQSYRLCLLWEEYNNIKLMMLIKIYNVTFTDKDHI